jgi:hypothetical protein
MASLGTTKPCRYGANCHNKKTYSFLYPPVECRFGLRCKKLANNTCPFLHSSSSPSFGGFSSKLSKTPSIPEEKEKTAKIESVDDLHAFFSFYLKGKKIDDYIKGILVNGKLKLPHPEKAPLLCIVSYIYGNNLVYRDEKEVPLVIVVQFLNDLLALDQDALVKKYTEDGNNRFLSWFANWRSKNINLDAIRQEIFSFYQKKEHLAKSLANWRPSESLIEKMNDLAKNIKAEKMNEKDAEEILVRFVNEVMPKLSEPFTNLRLIDGLNPLFKIANFLYRAKYIQSKGEESSIKELITILVDEARIMNRREKEPKVKFSVKDIISTAFDPKNPNCLRGITEKNIKTLAVSLIQECLNELDDNPAFESSNPKCAIVLLHNEYIKHVEEEDFDLATLIATL